MLKVLIKYEEGLRAAFHCKNKKMLPIITRIKDKLNGTSKYYFFRARYETLGI